MADITHQQLLDGITDMLSRISDEMVTKQDLKDTLANYPTKQDLKDTLADYPTKQDLKDELKNYATKDDLFGVEARLGNKLDSHKRASIQYHLTTRAMIGELSRQSL